MLILVRRAVHGLLIHVVTITVTVHVAVLRGDPRRHARFDGLQVTDGRVEHVVLAQLAAARADDAAGFNGGPVRRVRLVHAVQGARVGGTEVGEGVVFNSAHAAVANGLVNGRVGAAGLHVVARAHQPRLVREIRHGRGYVVVLIHKPGGRVPDVALCQNDLFRAGAERVEVGVQLQGSALGRGGHGVTRASAGGRHAVQVGATRCFVRAAAVDTQFHAGVKHVVVRRVVRLLVMRREPELRLGAGVVPRVDHVLLREILAYDGCR